MAAGRQNNGRLRRNALRHGRKHAGRIEVVVLGGALTPLRITQRSLDLKANALTRQGVGPLEPWMSPTLHARGIRGKQTRHLRRDRDVALTSPNCSR